MNKDNIQLNSVVASQLRESTDIILESEITCPECGHKSIEKMPRDACQYFFDCRGCSAVLKPLQGDCCVFCSYGTVKCPPIQTGDCCGGA